MSRMTDLADEYRPSMTLEVLHSWAVEVVARLRGEAAPEGPTVADDLIEAAFDDGFIVSKNFPATFLTEEANREMAWTVGRSLPPYCNDAGERQWSGPTAQAAISVARAALGMPTASPAPVAGDAVAALPAKWRAAAEARDEDGIYWQGHSQRMHMQSAANELDAALAQDLTNKGN